jgi:WD40 repeat protein
MRKDIEQKIQASGSTPERAYALSKNDWTSIKFNKSGRQILFCSKGVLISVDGFEGTVLHSFLTEADVSNTSSLPMAGCFTPDDRTVLCGNENGSVSCYDANTGLLLRKLRGHVGRVECIAVNPRYSQFASACTNTALWIW